MHNPLIKIVLFVLFYTSFTLGCALCKSEIPTIHTTIDANFTKSSQSFDIVWQFNPEFCNETLLVYDKNKNKNLDRDELQEVQKNLEDYLNEHQYLSYFYFTKPEDNSSIELIDMNVSQQHMSYENQTIIYRYHLQANVELQANQVYSLEFLDRQMLFNFFVLTFNTTKPFKVTKAQNAVSFTLSNTPTQTYQDNNSTTPQTNDSNAFLSFLSAQLAHIKAILQSTLTTLQTTHSPKAYLWLLMFSFLYGVIHAIGPGHGKSLVASYFLSGNASPAKALSMAGMIGLVHTFSAFLFSFVLYYIIKGLLSTHFSSVESIATKVSAGIIVAIALYLLYQKLRRPKIRHFQVASKPNSLLQQPTKHLSSCSCASCNTQSTDIGVVIGAGIIPCPGTVTIFIFSFSLGIYLVGFLSAIFMSLGMSLIIFIMAYLSIKIKQSAVQNSKIKKVMEYLSLLFILGLGLLLLVV